MDEETKRKILELTRQLHQLGCEVGMDNTGQIVIYTGVEVLDENSIGWHQTRGYVHGSFVNPKSFTRQTRLPSSFNFVKVISFTRRDGGGHGENSWRKVAKCFDGNTVSGYCVSVDMKNLPTQKVPVESLPDYLRTLGTACRFISMETEVEVDARKTNNPFVGATKRSRRNGLVNINYLDGIIRRMKEAGIEQPVYVPGKIWYVHEHDTNGNALALCQSKKDHTKKYLQYFPFRSYNNTYYHNGIRLTDKEVEVLKTFINKPASIKPFKRSVITFSMDSILKITFRNINTEVLNLDKLFRE